MLLDKLIADVEARGGVSRAFQCILAASVLTNILLAAVLFTMDRTVRTVLTPPEISKSFWVDGRTLSQEYLEQMGTWVVQQFATVSPANIDYQTGMLLRYVHPSVHGELAIRFKAGANRIKAEHISKVFFPREVRISEKGQSLVLIGAQSTWIADKRVPNDELKAYLVSFDYDGSRTYIKELRETNPARPFDGQAQQPEEAETVVQQVEPAQPSLPKDESQAKTPGGASQGEAKPSPPQSLPPPPQSSSPQAIEALQAGIAPTQQSTQSP